MVFPKKRFTSSVRTSGADSPLSSTSSAASVLSDNCAPNGLDLLTAAIASSESSSTNEPTLKSRAISEYGSNYTAIPESDNEGGNNSSFVSASMAGPTTIKRSSFSKVGKPSSHNYSGEIKRSKTFPEILLEILSNMSYTSIISWLPTGNSFAIHDVARFSSVILPKYFRKVIFRSFIRKLNRWGFRSVKRSVSGFESTFEHKYFIRDEPGLSSRMFCKSNPASKVATAKKSSSSGGGSKGSSSSSTSTDSSVKKVNVPLVNGSNINISSSANSSPNNSRAAITAAASAAAGSTNNQVVPPVVFSQVQPPNLMNNNEAFLSQLSSNTLVSQPTKLEELLLLRELQQQRERLQLMSLVQQMNQITREDVLQLLLARQQQQR